MELALFTHVLGAMLLVGGLLSGASVLALARGDVRLLRLGYWTLLAVALPGYLVMRIGAQWIYSEQGWDDVPDDLSPAWISIGVRRLGRGSGTGLLKAAMVIAWIVLAAALVAVWAMSGKPN